MKWPNKIMKESTGIGPLQPSSTWLRRRCPPRALGCCKAVHHLVAALSVQVHVIMCFHGDADARLMDAFS
jgi:hypothetical protein